MDELWQQLLYIILYGGGGASLGALLLKAWQLWRKYRQDDFTYISDHMRKVIRERDEEIEKKDHTNDRLVNCLAMLEEDMSKLKESYIKEKLKRLELEGKLAAYEKHPDH